MDFMIFNIVTQFFVFFVLIFFTGCQPSHYHFDQVKEPIPEVVFNKKEVGVALVLGGGGARGMFHVGVLEVLQEANIPIDLIVGCSAGAMVGALYADCPNGKHVKDLLISLKRKDLLEINLFSCRYGVSKGRFLKRFLARNLCARNFEELQIPFITVATDLEAGDVVSLSSGPIIPAVYASCAVPFFFEPVKLYGRILVDGGVLDPNPVSTAKKYNPKIIIAVDLAELLPVTKPSHLFNIATRSAEIIHLKISRHCLIDADIIIRPSLEPIGMFDDTRISDLYEDGKRAAKKALFDIQELYEKRMCSHSPSFHY